MVSLGGQPFSVTSSPGGPDRPARCAMAGELDLAWADEAAAALERAIREAPEELEIDLRELEYIDSSGLRVLARAASLAAESEVEVSVHVTRDGQTARVLSLTEMDRLLRIEESDPADDGRPPDET
jgi:anti-anti-sigma factor